MGETKIEGKKVNQRCNDCKMVREKLKKKSICLCICSIYCNCKEYRNLLIGELLQEGGGVVDWGGHIYGGMYEN